MLSINVMSAKLRIMLSKRRWKERNPEAVREGCKRYHNLHIEKERARKKKWHKDNPVQTACNKRRWEKDNYEKNRKASNVRVLKWVKLHPEKTREWCRKRRAQRLGIGGVFTSAQWAECKAVYGNTCLCCHRTEADLHSANLMLVPDHIMPISKGGSNDIGNIQPLCHGKGGCNNKKNSRFADYRPEKLS